MKIAYDTTLKRPGCVILQAAMGGDAELAHRFPTASWLVAPTPDMKVREITEEQVKILVAMAEKEYGRV